MSAAKVRLLIKQEVDLGLAARELKEALTHDCRYSCPACLIMYTVRRPVFPRAMNLLGGPARSFSKVYIDNTGPYLAGFDFSKYI